MSEAGGVWAVVDRDMGEHISMVFPSELEALRVLNGRGFGSVVFVPWGEGLES